MKSEQRRLGRIKGAKTKQFNAAVRNYGPDSVQASKAKEAVLDADKALIKLALRNINDLTDYYGVVYEEEYN